MVRIVSPGAKTLVANPVVVKISMAGNPSTIEVRTDEGTMTSAFRRVGRDWVGVLPRLNGGPNTLQVSARIAGTGYRAQVSFTVKGRAADLISARPVTGPYDRLAGDGVEPLALRIDPDAVAVARLNGRPVTLPRPGVGTVRRFALSLADGLRAGSNTVVVTAHRADGAWETWTHRFVVASDALLAEAGPHQQVLAGHVVTLDAAGSRSPVPGAPRTYRWELLAGPRGRLPLPLRPGPKATVKLTKPGRYVFRLTVVERRTDGLHRSNDLVTVGASPPEPAIGARLIATPPDGADVSEAGLRIGTQSWPWESYLRPERGRSAAILAINPQYLRPPDGENEEVRPTFIGAATADRDIAEFLNGVQKNDIIVVLGSAGCCQPSTVLPHGVPFSHVVAYDGKGLANFAKGAWNRGLNYNDESGELLADGVLTGNLRWQPGGQTAAGEPYAAGFRFTQDSDAAYSTNSSTAVTTAPNDGATYRLVDPDRRLAIASPGPARGSVSVQPSSPDLGQQWEMVRGYGDFYQLHNRANGLCLNLSGSDDATVLQWPCSGLHQPNELWLPRRVSDGSWTLESAADSTPLRLVRRSSGELGVTPDLITGDQKWLFDTPPGLYAITASNSNLTLAEPDYLPTGGAQALVADDTGELNQQWQLLDQDPGVFVIRNLGSGACLSAPAATSAPVVRTTCDLGSTDQRWTVVADDQGIKIQRAGTDLVLVRSFAAGAKNTLIVKTHDPSASDETTWNIDRQPEPVAGGFYSILTVGEPGSLRLSPDGTSAEAAVPTAPNDAQNWVLRSYPDAAGAIQIQSVKSGRCLSRLGRSEDAVTAVGMSACDTHGSGWDLRSGPAGSTRFALPGFDLFLGFDESGSLVFGSSSQPDGAPWLLTGRSQAFTVAGERYVTSLPSGSSGFAVLALGPGRQPEPGYPKPYLTSGPTATALASDLEALTAAGQRTVLVQSVGRPKPTSAFTGIAAGTAGIGGDAGAVLALDGTGDIAIAGCSGCVRQPVYSEAEHRSDDTSANIAGARLEGTLRRDSSGTLVPVAGTISRIDATLFALATRPATTWPFDELGPDGSLADPIEHRIVNAFGDNLRLARTCDLVQDAVRAAYCATTGTIVTLDANLLDSVTDAQMATLVPGATPDQTRRVRETLRAEFGQVNAVSRFMTNESQAFSSALLGGSGNEAAVISQDIRDKLPTHTDKPGIVGGILDVLSAAMFLMRPVIFPAGPDAPGSGGEKAYDTVTAALSLVSALLGLAGNNDDASDSVSEELDSTALQYSTELDHQNATLVSNLPQVYNILVNDPVKLRLSSANSELGWSAAPGPGYPGIETLLTRGITSNLWSVLMPVAYEMWQWPSLPADTRPQQIACSDKLQYVLMYPKQARSGMFQPPARLDNSGEVVGRRTLALTLVGHSDISEKVDRSLPDSLASDFYGGVGLVPAEVARAVPWRWRNYPKDMTIPAALVGVPNPCLLMISKTSFKPFGPRYY